MLHSTPSAASAARWDALGDAVRWVVASRATGVLLVDGDRESGSLHFEGGRITLAHTGDRPLESPPPNLASDLAELVDEVVVRLAANDAVALDFRPDLAPIGGGAALPADQWFDLGEPEPFTVYRLTRIA